MSHSKRDFAILLLPWWMRYASTFRKCWTVAPSDPPSHRGVMPWCWWERRMGHYGFASTSVAWMPEPKRMPIPCLVCRKPWRAWWVPDTFLVWTWRVGSGKSRWTEESRQYTTFTVGSMGIYEFLRMPYGLCNAPATFQHLMQNCLGELNLTYALIYLDNVIVYSKTEDEHLVHLRAILERFMENGLKLKAVQM